MQKTFVKIISKKILTTAFIAGVSVMTASAATDHCIEIVSPGIESSVTFTGSAENAFYFDVKIDNPANETILVEVRNDDGEVLFSKTCSGENILKRIKIENEHLTAHYKFTVKPANKEAAEIFVVSITTKMVDEPVTA